MALDTPVCLSRGKTGHTY
ncbi:hypothetical protein F383_13985 [Gossypium arboreum]|uniref:Uncharacterized protein n=1 Tax=Gossypium arboreum TaxID=29729 RepID=A0A0B0NKI4_GOSAR|nr:hypothetical protein F383_13985 [Gossypium arboreum]